MNNILLRFFVRKVYLVVFQSAEIMMKFKQYNARIDEHNVLLEKVSQLVPKSLRQGMVSHYWYVILDLFIW
jgi:hypothetical protein